jgi:hypothetical protein
MKIKFEGKIKMEKLMDTQTVFKLLQFLNQEKGFTVTKIKTDEIKLTKNFLPSAGAENSSACSAVEIKVEIEISKDSTEIEVKCAELEYIKDLISELTTFLAGADAGAAPRQTEDDL